MINIIHDLRHATQLRNLLTKLLLTWNSASQGFKISERHYYIMSPVVITEQNQYKVFLKEQRKLNFKRNHYNSAIFVITEIIKGRQNYC